MAKAGITEKLARASSRRPWLVVGIWVLLFAGGAFLGSGINKVLTTDEGMSVEPESAKANRLIEERLHAERASEFVIITSDEVTVDDGRFRTFVQDAATRIRGLQGTVDQAVTYYDTGDEHLVSMDRHTTIIPVLVSGDLIDASETVVPLLEVVKESQRDGFEVLTTGNGSVSREFQHTSERDLQKGEMISLPVAIIVLLLVFGAAVAAGIPIAVAVLSIIVSVGVSAIIGQFFDLSFFVVNMITMIGLAVGIDYSLFIIHRYRDERAAGFEVREAVGRTGATAGRAVLFSGGTVVVALAGLFIVPTSIYRSLAIGAVTVAVVTVAAAMTLLPAVLTLLGDRVNAIRPPFFGRKRASGSGGPWSLLTEIIMAHPVVATAASVSLLLVAAAPVLTMDLGIGGVSTLPEGSDSRRAFGMLDSEFAGGMISPTEIVIDGSISDPEVQAGINHLEHTLSEDGMFAAPVTETNEARDLAVISVPLNSDPSTTAARNAIMRLRGDYIPAAFEGAPAEVLVTGTTAETQDMLDLMAHYMPIVFAFVLGLSFVLLLIVFRSIVVPFKAILMNLLSVGAAYGLLVLVFQHGVGNEIFGFQRAESIEAWLPLFLFAVLFGLSMDYHVFLLSRIKERFDETGDNAAAVAYGMTSTSGLITGAALIMVTVFAGFATASLSSMQQMGFGLAVAVILDATIIRSILVPASMQLLGNRNWYLPAWMAWLPEFSIEGAPAYARAECRGVECLCEAMPTMAPAG